MAASNPIPAPYYTDLHVHPWFRPAMLKAVDSPWQDWDESPVEKRAERTAKICQSSFPKLLAGNVRIASSYFIIPERAIYSRLISSPSVVARYFGMDVKTLRENLTTQPFKLLKRQLKFALDQLEEPGNTGRKATVAKNWKHLEQILAQPDTLALVLGIEGAHNLGMEYSEEDFPNPARRYNFKNKVEAAEPLTTELIDHRVEWMKKHHIFWLTLNHFVYNRLSSMPKAAELTGWKRIAPNPFSSMWPLGNYSGLTFMGSYLVERCMENNITLDLKHCDALTRHQIYQLAAKHGRPVVGSHVAFSGRPTNVSGNGMIVLEDYPDDRKKAETLNPWDINFHDDDIVAIHRLGGLMGLILDRRVLASVNMLAAVKASGNWIQLLYNQIQYAYKVLVAAGVDPEQAFDSLSIGSDFDGMIESLPAIPSAREYYWNPLTDKPEDQRLDMQLLNVLEQNRKDFAASGLDPAEIVAKILHGNKVRFLQRNFV